MVEPIKVPFYTQSHDFTCGPASLMMAIAYFDPDLELDRDTEIDIWREATLHETKGTCRYGLALSALNRGLGARMLCTTDDIVYRQRIVERYKDLNEEFMDFLFNDLRDRCRKAGLRDERGVVTVDAIRDSLDRGEVPIIMCSTAMFLDEDIPHWIVVTGLGKDIVHVNNPLNDGPETVGMERFKKHIGCQGEGAMISIFRKKD